MGVDGCRDVVMTTNQFNPTTPPSLHSEFYLLPDLLICSFGADRATSETHMIHCPQASHGWIRSMHIHEPTHSPTTTSTTTIHRTRTWTCTATARRRT